MKDEWWRMSIWMKDVGWGMSIWLKDEGWICGWRLSIWLKDEGWIYDWRMKNERGVYGWRMSLWIKDEYMDEGLWIKDEYMDDGWRMSVERAERKDKTNPGAPMPRLVMLRFFTRTFRILSVSCFRAFKSLPRVHLTYSHKHIKIGEFVFPSSFFVNIGREMGRGKFYN